MNPSTLIHHGGLNGLPQCGAQGGRISTSGLQQFLTCPTCRELCRPISREETLAALQQQLDVFTRANKGV